MKHPERRPVVWTDPTGVKRLVSVAREVDGRWIADISSMPGVLAYGWTVQEATVKAIGLALDVLYDKAH